MKDKAQTNKVQCECGDVYAAIAMALYETLGGVHDVEEQVLTIRRAHTAWSGKWHVLRVLPQRK